MGKQAAMSVVTPDLTASLAAPAAEPPRALADVGPVTASATPFVKARIALAGVTLAAAPWPLASDLLDYRVAIGLLVLGVLMLVAALCAPRSAGPLRAYTVSAVIAAVCTLALVLLGLPLVAAAVLLAAIGFEAARAAPVATRRAAGAVLCGGFLASALVVMLGAAAPLGGAASSMAAAAMVVGAAPFLIAGLAVPAAPGAAAAPANAPHLTLDRASAVLSEVVLSVERSGVVSATSPNSFTVLGLPPDALLGRGLFDRTLVADRPMLLVAIGESLGTGARQSLRMRLAQRPAEDGAGASYGWVAVEVVGDPTDPSRALVAIRDIAALVIMESEASAKAVEAETAQEARGAFLSTINHELRTPLNAIIGFSEILANPDLGTPSAERTQEYARIIHGAGNDLMRMVTAMVDITRLESGVYAFTPEERGLGDAVRLCVDGSLAEMASTRSVAVILPESDVAMPIDVRVLRQIMAQLLSNAIKFSAEDSPIAVEVTLGDMAEITIVDRGCGIRAEQLPRLDSRLERLDQAHKRATGGIGLGLTLVRGLAHLHGGRFRLESSDGVGTRATIALPFAPAGASDPRLAGPSHTSSSRPATVAPLRERRRHA
jgi:cell cycle sensor histidine kinase DivJ